MEQEESYTIAEAASALSKLSPGSFSVKPIEPEKVQKRMGLPRVSGAPSKRTKLPKQVIFESPFVTIKDWEVILAAMVKSNDLVVIDGKVMTDDVNAALAVHPSWRMSGIRLPSVRQAALNVVEHFDFSMGAKSYFERGAVLPVDAAWLLCQFNPSDDAANPEGVTNSETNPQDFRLLRGNLLDVHRDGKARSLMDWLELTKGRGWRYHSWIDDYVKARKLIGFPVLPSPQTDDVPVAPQVETPVQRRSRRYQMCLDAGLVMPNTDYAPLPRGIGELAAQERITRQAFSEDVKAHIARLPRK